jgi:predicted house-cleaning NTP pyrophosphatase (Maf/HAM1 superfamily)
MTIKPFSQTFSEAVAAIRMADPSLTNLETIHELAWTKAKSEARTVQLTTMGDPLTDPTKPSAEIQKQYSDLDLNLITSDARAALQHAITAKPKTPAPALNHNYAAALEKIKVSPEMTMSTAVAVLRAAKAKDDQALVDRNAALSNPSPNNAWSELAS